MNATWEGSPNLEGLGFQSKFILWLTVDGIQGNLNCGIAREREKKRENFRTKSYKLRHCQACSQNKGLSKYQRRASQLRTSPSPAGGREAGGLQPELERDNLGPRDGILYQIASRLPVANQVFLGSWMVDIHQEGCSPRSAPQRRHMAHLRQRSCCAPRKPSGCDQGGDKTHHPTWGECARQVPGHLSCSDLGRAQNTDPTKSVLLWSTREPEPEWLRPGKCMQSRAHCRQFPCRATWSLSSVDWESTHTVSGGKPSVPETLRAHCEHSPNTPVTFVCSVPPSPQHDWTSEPK